MSNFIIFLIFLIAFVKSIYFSYFGLNLFDYGESLHNGTRLLEGAVLYKDIWAFFPPADNYLPALILRFWNHLLTVRFVESFVFALLVGLIVLFAQKLVSKRLLFLMGIAVIFSDLNTYLLFFQLFFFLSLFFFLRFLEKKKNFWLFWAGVFGGVGALFRHDTAIAAGAALLLITLLVKGRFNLNVSRVLSYLLISFLIVVAPVVLWLVQQGTLGEFIYLGFIKAPQISRILSSAFDFASVFARPLTPAQGFQAFTLVFYGFYLAAYLLMGFYLYKKMKTQRFLLKETMLLVLLLYGIFQIPYAFSVIEMGHLVKAGLPVFIFGAFLAQEGLRQKWLGKQSFVLATPLLLFILGNFAASLWWINYNNTRVDFKQGFVFVNSQHIKGNTHPTAESLKKALGFIEENTSRGDYIFAAPYHAMLYFLSERKAPSRFNNFAAGFLSLNEQDEAISAIKEKNVRIVIYDPVNAPHGKLFADYSPKVHNYLMTNFETVEETDMGWLLMKRK